ncbi:hypothetical protein ACF08M_30350 [Streptomyces sp. NPDC015032]|uniref:hypothetical protein n=1 Tax=Streptomyces sp. NPDC015032 TaxID=3364937 RepID=UPI0036F7DD7B
MPYGNVQETIVDRRQIPVIPGPGRQRVDQNFVRLPNGFWIDLATGFQDSSGAAHFERT